MMSRRQFIKRLLVGGVALTGGGALLMQALKDLDTKGSAETLGQPASPTAASSEDGLLLSFFLLSDVHISKGVSVTTDKLHSALKDISRFESPVDTIVFGGDITEGGEKDYKQLGKILDDYNLPPLYANMGNHEYYDIWVNKDGQFSSDTQPNGKTDAMSRERFMKFFGYKEKPYKDVWINDVHLIMMSQEAYVQERPEVSEGAWYSDEQLAWLTDIMKAHADGKKPAFIFIHQPLPAPGTDGGNHRVIRAKEFRAILEPYKNVFVLSGHTHRNFATENHYNTENSFHWFNNASVGKTRNSNNPDVSQGMYVQVYKDKVVVRGREFSDRTWIEPANYTVPLV